MLAEEMSYYIHNIIQYCKLWIKHFTLVFKRISDLGYYVRELHKNLEFE